MIQHKIVYPVAQFGTTQEIWTVFHSQGQCHRAVTTQQSHTTLVQRALRHDSSVQPLGNSKVIQKVTKNILPIKATTLGSFQPMAFLKYHVTVIPSIPPSYLPAPTCNFST